MSIICRLFFDYFWHFVVKVDKRSTYSRQKIDDKVDIMSASFVDFMSIFCRLYVDICRSFVDICRSFVDLIVDFFSIFGILWSRSTKGRHISSTKDRHKSTKDRHKVGIFCRLYVDLLSTLCRYMSIFCRYMIDICRSFVDFFSIFGILWSRSTKGRHIVDKRSTYSRFMVDL